MAVIYWAGDSTVQYNDITTYPQTGIGQVMGLYLKPEVRVENHAKNGRSTKSFLNQKLFEPIREQMSEGDFLFIQFGHNDEKLDNPERGTHPQGDFKDNLRLFIRTARGKKANPVLITPVERWMRDENNVLLESTHTLYCEAIREVGEELSVPLVDLCRKSRKKLLKTPFHEIEEWYMHLPAGKYANYPEGLTDNTHLRYPGAVTYAGCIAEGLGELGGIYAGLLL